MAFPKRNVMTSSKSEGVFKPAPYGDDTLEWTEVFPVSPEYVYFLLFVLSFCFLCPLIIYWLDLL